MKEKNFEIAMDRLNEIVAKLEKNEASLDEAISLFEEGLELVKFCDSKLKHFEERVDELIKDYQK
ncbi:MAG: exodeoxyribonuclease VII small subunit [Erysipelotrichaceae bacterium]|nr:exodeoxyribonuclease VII small subunit [Erysipelotrichaceae bacterium]MDD3923482.1 exodeoxyribonuclease VII small subunit [Erysipelotrichaceae bacterium]MDD4643366.1 exodeoxyribonuclease VII small subunit [Erysipelotrichaceae bacterium]